MPVTIAAPITVFDQPAFHLVDEQITGLAFAIHNEFGRYLTERLYQAELLRRLQECGCESHREVKISVMLDGFIKDYFIDFLVRHGVIVETKAVEALTAAHRAQLLTYLFLAGLHHGTLLNFRTERVQHEFVSTRLTHETRRRVSYVTNHWQPLSERCRLMVDTLRRAMTDWGCGLDPSLYRDAVTHFLGGEVGVVRNIPVRSGATVIGAQKVHLLTDEVAFSITTAVHRPDVVLEHQRRFLAHTPLRAIQWINLNRQTVSLVTITK